MCSRGTGKPSKYVFNELQTQFLNLTSVQYIQPEDAHVLGQAELVIIDEAAAIPLPLVRNLIGPYLVFLASTINGYEGTGRSLSLKLIQQLRESTRSTPSTPANTVSKDDAAPASTKKKAAAAPAPHTLIAERVTGIDIDNAQLGRLKD